MSSQRYERVANTDNDHAEHAQSASSPSTSAAASISPPPSFRSRTSSPSATIRPHRRTSSAVVDPNLADAFGADGSDSDDDDEVDDRQRLMRGTATSSLPSATSPDRRASTDSVANANAETRPQTIERRSTQIPHLPPSQPPTSGAGRVYGGGSGTDGVFANLSAKPETGEKLEEHPPTYEQAAADAAPPYWETTILAPGLGGPDEVYVEGLPVGSIFSFLWNCMISMSFQLVGFLLTYLLHTTHAAKNGSRAGLGITLIQYGFYMKGGNDAGPPSSDPGNTEPSYVPSGNPDSHDFDASAVVAAAAGASDGSSSSGSGGAGGITANEWASYALMIVGWFILIRAVGDFLKARRHEQLVLQSPDRGLGVAVIAEGERDETVV